MMQATPTIKLNMKILLSTSFIILLHFLAPAQTMLFTKSGTIQFFSKTPLENIEAVNKEASSFLNLQNGELVFSLLVKNFRFEKALMEEHFNENYMESDKFPKANFKGKISNLSATNFSKEGVYPCLINGNIVIHGVSKAIDLPANITVKQGKVIATAKFQVKPADFNISIPALLKGKIAEQIEVNVNAHYEPYKK